MTTKTQRRIKFFRDFCWLITRAKVEREIDVLVHCYYRTEAQQRNLYSNGKSKTEHSAHQDWLAIDIVVVRDGELIWEINEDYKWLGEQWGAMGHIWGGNWSFRDGCHFQCGDEI